MSNYERTDSGLVICVSESGEIPLMVPNSLDYAAYLAWVAAGNTADPLPASTLADLQAAKLVVINTAFDQAASALTNGYPEAEQKTWPAQQVEALAWEKDDTTPTPYLDGIATKRGIDLLDMRQRTLAQVNIFLAASQDLVGTRQRLSDAIYAAEDAAALDLIVWPTE